MRALIVDDEEPARSKLRRMLAAFDDVEVLGEAAGGAAAMEMVAALRPDVIFVDVQMPEVDGFAVAASLPDDGPQVVFVTAYDRYALQAFDAHAADYLLKPVEPARLELAIQRLRSSRRSPMARADAVAPPQHLLIPERGALHVVRCADIAWLQSADNYVNLHLAGRTLLMRRTLASLLLDLAPAFVRTHRGAAVALASVQEVRPTGNGDAVVVLKDGAEVPCSRQHKAALMQQLACRPRAGGDPKR